MDFTLVDPIARAILYEGYLLYPYRTSSLKNREPCAFGSLYPRAHSLANGETEPWSMQTECLVRGDGQTTLQGMVRFLQSVTACPSPSGRGETIVDREVTEREVRLPERGLRELASQAVSICFSFGDGNSKSLQGCVDLSAVDANDSTFKVRVRIVNETPPDLADQPIMLSTHAILGVRGGRFLSLIDPPANVRALAETCQNRGVWPVLVGDRDREDMILVAPIILYDFPQIAPESPGNLFDGTEIDEVLTLRILTLTEAEKKAMKRDERTHALLERTEKLASEQMLALHGAMRVSSPLPSSLAGGDRVRLRPSGQADIFDLALEGMRATIASIEQDLEGRVLYTVVLDDDPGQDLGIEGKPGHRFFFRREELELVSGDGR